MFGIAFPGWDRPFPVFKNTLFQDGFNMFRGELNLNIKTVQNAGIVGAAPFLPFNDFPERFLRRYNQP